MGVKSIGSLVVPDTVYHTAHGGINVYITLAAHFSCKYHLSTSGKHFAGNFGLRIGSNKAIYYGVGNLVTDFVGVTFRYGFGCKEVTHTFFFD